MKESAQEYLKYGFNCIPVNKDKSPSCDWKHYQNNKITELGLFSTDFIAVVCGSISDNLEVLDFDNHQNTADENIKSYLEFDLVKEIYDKYKLPVIKTPGGGYHIYYRSDKIDQNQKLASIPVWNEKLRRNIPDAIIETRGEGGYVLAPPSNGYKLIRNSFKDLQFITESERTILLEFARSFDKFDNTKKIKVNVSDEKPGNIYDNTTEAIQEAKEALISIGWTELNFNNGWCRPGKNKGISATFGNVAPNVFYCFTVNAEYFEDRKGYTPFQIVGLIKYNGDFNKFAKELAKRYNLHTKVEEQKEEEKSDELLKKIQLYKLDWNKEYKLPDFVIKIREETGKLYNIGSLGNFSAFTGKSKSRKSFARQFIEAAAIGNKTILNKFVVRLPDNKQNILTFDTEQGLVNVMKAAYNAVSLAEIPTINHYNVYALRDFSYLERCQAIELIISQTKNLGIVFIDGVADLAFGNNDEKEGNRVVQLLMTWTAKYNIHINTVIHQPKGSDWATGHLGSSIEKKAESVINIKKDGAYSIFEPKQLRNCADFTPFPFIINSDGLPELITEQTEINQIFEEEI